MRFTEDMVININKEPFLKTYDSYAYQVSLNGKRVTIVNRSDEVSFFLNVYFVFLYVYVKYKNSWL
jgi:hypothetical protein